MRRKHLLLAALALFLPALALPRVTVAAGDGSTDVPPYRMVKSVFGAAGTAGSTTAFRAKGTAGQPGPIGFATVTGARLYAGFWVNLPGGSVDVEPPLAVRTFHNGLLPGHPNPFRGRTTIGYSLASGGPLAMELLDVSGRKVRTLFAGRAAAGEYRTTWDGRDDRGMELPAGIYFCRLTAGSFTSVQRTLLLR